MIATFRIILVADGHKIVSSILLFFTSVIWIVSSSMTIVNMNLIGILVFSIGSLIGSYAGSLIEEKMAIGNRLIICISTTDIVDKLRDKGYIVTELKGEGIDGFKSILLIVIGRKKIKELRHDIGIYDKKALILKENINV